MGQPQGFLANVTGQAAAVGGVIIVWSNGLGPLTVTPATGSASGLGNPLPLVTKTVRVFIGGMEAITVVPFLQQTSVGLNQVNVVVPEGVEPGDQVPIVIEVDCDDKTVLRSREDATIAVRARPGGGGGAPVGSSCGAASDCLSGLICPIVSAGSNDRVCVDPGLGVYDDGSGPSIQMVRNDWIRKRVDDWETKDLRCDDGSPYAYYISPGVGVDVDNWLFFFKGGASCGNDEACALRWSIQPQFMRQWRSVSPSYTPGRQSGPDAGLFSRDEPSNHFLNWTFVHLHYCSSDVFSGTATPAQNPTGFYFRGRSITEAVVDELLDGIDPSLPRLAQANQVVVSGGSAGASGARHNMDMMADRILARRPSAVVKGIADSAISPPLYPSQWWSQRIDATLCLEGKVRWMRGKQKKKRKRKRREYTAAELAEVWDGWERGESSKAIAGALDRGATVYYLLLRYGGIRPRARCRSARALTLAEREEISRGIAAGRTIRSIARILSRPASTLSREIRRNGGYDAYRASEADERTWERARRPKRCRLARCPRLRRLVEEKLREGWAPQQIAGWLKRTYPENESYQVSHETIYRSLFIQARGAFKKGLTQYLRSKRTIRRSQHASRKGRGGGQIQDLISIRERPAAVEDRAVPGHWEGDLLAGSNNSHIATLVERHSRYVMLAKVASKETATVVTALIEHARQLPGELYQSLTWDRGLEMADHKRFTLATDIAVYFCDPKSPWQRGSNENTNGLLRQYFPKGTDLSVHSQEHLNKIARKLNGRPRQTLEFETPAERFNACVASTG